MPSRIARAPPIKEKKERHLSSARFALIDLIGCSVKIDAVSTAVANACCIYYFVTRNTMSDGVYGKDQRISREEALRFSTINNAYLSFDEKSTGHLKRASSLTSSCFLTIS